MFFIVVSQCHIISLKMEVSSYTTILYEDMSKQYIYIQARMDTVNHLIGRNHYTILLWIAGSKYSGEREQQQQVQLRI